MSPRFTHHLSTLPILLIVALAASCGAHGASDDAPGPGSGNPDASIVSGAPRILYTDTLTGPIAGGEDGQGGYLSIYGTNFGAAADLGDTTKVLIGGIAVANYRALVPAKVAGKLEIQQIAVQVGDLGGAATAHAAAAFEPDGQTAPGDDFMLRARPAGTPDIGAFEAP
jgi:hypothetical protein